MGPFYDPNNQDVIPIGHNNLWSFMILTSDHLNFQMKNKNKKQFDAIQAIHLSKQKVTKAKKTELVEMLIKTYVQKRLWIQSLLNIHLKNMQERAIALSMDIERQQAMSNGTLQVLWERWFVDESDYTIKFLNDDRTSMPGLSFGHLIEMFHDFQWGLTSGAYQSRNWCKSTDHR